MTKRLKKLYTRCSESHAIRCPLPNFSPKPFSRTLLPTAKPVKTASHRCVALSPTSSLVSLPIYHPPDFRPGINIPTSDRHAFPNFTPMTSKLTLKLTLKLIDVLIQMLCHPVFVLRSSRLFQVLSSPSLSGHWSDTRRSCLDDRRTSRLRPLSDRDEAGHDSEQPGYSSGCHGACLPTNVRSSPLICEIWHGFVDKSVVLVDTQPESMTLRPV